MTLIEGVTVGITVGSIIHPSTIWIPILYHTCGPFNLNHQNRPSVPYPSIDNLVNRISMSTFFVPTIYVQHTPHERKERMFRKRTGLSILSRVLPASPESFQII